MRESAATMEENYKTFHQEEGIIVVQAIIDDLFEEVLGFRVSSEHGGGHSSAEEERYSSPRWDEGHTKLVYEIHRISRMYGGAAHPTSSLDTIIHSTSIHSMVFGIWICHHDREEEKKLTHLEKRLVANVNSDDQALQVLGFHTDITTCWET
jgi:hypothetical protein